MKKLLLLTAVAVTGSLYAESMQDIQKKQEAIRIAYLEKEGLPIPGAGVKVIPERQMASYNEMNADRSRELAQIKKQGYIIDHVSEIESLLNMGRMSKTGQLESAYKNGMFRTTGELKEKMAYDFRGVPEGQISTFIGIAPAITYVQDKGWIGAIQYFINDKAGTCTYLENNVQLSLGSVVLPAEQTTYDINSKGTSKIIFGEVGKGFRYDVEWYDNDFFRSLSCATETFDPAHMVTVIELAKQIDSDS